MLLGRTTGKGIQGGFYMGFWCWAGAMQANWLCFKKPAIKKKSYLFSYRCNEDLFLLNQKLKSWVVPWRSSGYDSMLTLLTSGFHLWSGDWDPTSSHCMLWPKMGQGHGKKIWTIMEAQECSDCLTPFLFSEFYVLNM